MTEREALEQKSLSDLVEIAVAFNLVSREEAESMDSGKLVSLIAKDEPVEEKKTEKKTAKKTATKKTAVAAKTADKTAEKKTTTRKTRAKKTEETEVAPEAEVKVEAAPEVVAATAEEEAPKPKKTTRKTKAKAAEEKAEDKPAEAVVEEAKAEEKPAEPAKKKTTRKTKAAKAEEAKEAEKAPEAPAEEKPSEEKPAEESSDKKKRKTTSKKTKGAKDVKTPIEEMAEKNEKAEVPAEAPAEEKAPEAKEEKPSDNKDVKTQKFEKNRKQKVKKRTISFGPSGEDGKPVMTQVSSEEVPAEQPEVKPEEPQEPQYAEIEGILSFGNGDKGDFNGFIHRNNYLPGDDDAFVQGQLIRRLGLRKGDHIKGLIPAVKGKEKYSPLKRVTHVNGVELNEETIDMIKKRKRFESLTAIYPDEKLRLETSAQDISTRIIDLFCPIGKGQRGMIVSPPKAGKTVLLKKVANSITANNPKCKLIVLLIDERPEEVTDMQRSIKGEVVYSTFDKRPENHVRVTELVLERAMRLVEMGEDVVILLDSMTRLARAYNLTINPTGRTLSGGLDPGSLYGPKRFFGAARNIENGGSLTIIATALIETGSRMDEVIFEEFKGTGNMEVTLDRKLADRRVFPAIAVDKSGTRREDLLLKPEELEAIWLLRKRIADVDTVAATDAVINFMQKTTNNTSFVLSIKKSFSVDE